jgi:outer membrane protein assembly factor BamB
MEGAAMFRSDAQHTGTIRGELPDGLRGVRWQADAGMILIAPVAAGGLVIAVSLEHGSRKNYGLLRAFDAQTGAPRWVFRGGAGMGVPGGITTTPAVSNEMVLFGSGEGLFYAVELATGRTVWEFKTGGRILSSPTVSGDTVYFGSADSAAYALDVASGNVLWRCEAGARVFAPLAFDSTTIYLADEEGRVHALGLGGEPLWREVLRGVRAVSVAVSRGVLLVSDASEGTLAALGLSTRAPLWTLRVAGRGPVIPAVSSGVVCVAGGGRVAGFDLASGEELWGLEVAEETKAPVIAGGVAVVAGRGGEIYGIDLTQGTRLWAREDGPGVLSEILIDEGALYFGDDHDRLVALE